MKTTRDVEPADINGSGSPVGGSAPEQTEILSNTCTAIMVVIPVARKQPNLVGAFIAIMIPRIITIKNTKIKNKQPTKPNSSAIIEKIKSLSAKGKKRYFCLELKSPTPNQPPLDNA